MPPHQVSESAPSSAAAARSSGASSASTARSRSSSTAVRRARGVGQQLGLLVGEHRVHQGQQPVLAADLFGATGGTLAELVGPALGEFGGPLHRPAGEARLIRGPGAAGKARVRGAVAPGRARGGGPGLPSLTSGDNWAERPRSRTFDLALGTRSPHRRPGRSRSAIRAGQRGEAPSPLWYLALRGSFGSSRPVRSSPRAQSSSPTMSSTRSTFLRALW